MATFGKCFSYWLVHSDLLHIESLLPASSDGLIQKWLVVILPIAIPYFSRNRCVGDSDGLIKDWYKTGLMTCYCYTYVSSGYLPFSCYCPPLLIFSESSVMTLLSLFFCLLSTLNHSGILYFFFSHLTIALYAQDAIALYGI